MKPGVPSLPFSWFSWFPDSRDVNQESKKAGAEKMGFPRQKVKARGVAPSEFGSAERVSNSFSGTRGLLVS
jgi:hypothetical protein